jgi:hypothetical protein
MKKIKILEKMKLKYTLIMLIGLLSLSVFFVIGWNAARIMFQHGNPIPAVKEAIVLATTVKPETFTELYFEDHLNLPKKIELEEEQSFKFTIHNLEHKDMTYKYDIKAIDNKEDITLSSGSATLSHNEYKTIDESYILATTSGRMKIQVLLVDQNQSIDYWMEKI